MVDSLAMTVNSIVRQSTKGQAHLARLICDMDGCGQQAYGEVTLPYDIYGDLTIFLCVRHWNEYTLAMDRLAERIPRF